MEKELLTIAEVQDVIPLGRTSIYSLINSGDLKRVHFGRKPFVTAESVRAYVERLTAQRAAT